MLPDTLPEMSGGPLGGFVDPERLPEMSGEPLGGFPLLWVNVMLAVLLKLDVP